MPGDRAAEQCCDGNQFGHREPEIAHRAILHGIAHVVQVGFPRMFVVEGRAGQAVVRGMVVQNDAVYRSQQPGCGEEQRQKQGDSFLKGGWYLHGGWPGRAGKINTPLSV